MRGKVKDYISTWEKRCYKNGIPEEAPTRLEQLNKVPSYKALVKAVFKNDTTLKTLGLTPAKCKVYHEYKRIELAQREKPKQLNLFSYEKE